jgi:titin
MKMKNNTILTLLIFTFALFSYSCDTIIDPPAIQTPIESGYGKISISFAGEKSPARSVLPSTVFDKYIYTFTKAGEQSGVVKTPDNNGFFILEIGSYTVAVQAYIGNAEPYTLAASGVSSAFSVGSGNNDPVIVHLSALTAGEQGEFSYTITYPAGVDAAITLQKWPDMDDIILTPLNLTAENGITETLELEIGSYLLTLLMSKGGLYAGISEAVHIQPSLTTIYAKDFDDNDFHDRASGAAVSAPTLNIVGPDSITINPVVQPDNKQTVEYGINTANTAPAVWQASVTFSGLDAGTAYYIFARAKENNIYHAGAASAPLPVITLNVPGAPQSFTAIPGNQQVSLSWSAPSSNGGSPIIRYEVSRNNGATWVTASTNTSHTFTGLTNGASYAFQVRAVNSIDAGVAASIAATPRSVPTAPLNLTTIADDGTIILSWTAPESDGGRPITGYQVSSNGGSTWVTPLFDIMHIFSNLTNGTSYTFQVRAINAVGNGEAASIIAAPATLPAAPQWLYAEPDNGQVALSWPNSSNDGGSAIIRYEVSSNNGSSWITAAGSNSHTFTGLTNGASYTFQVRAVNAAGYSAAASITATVGQRYTVTYSGNGATSGSVPAAQTVIVGSNVSITLPAQGTLLRSGYVFGGWNTLADGTGINYNAGSSYPPAADITLYARWNGLPYAPYYIERDEVISANSITIHWSASGSNGGGGVTGYRVYRKHPNDLTYTYVGTTASTSYTDPASSPYYYRVVAYNSYGESEPSDSVFTATSISGVVRGGRWRSEWYPTEHWLEFISNSEVREVDQGETWTYYYTTGTGYGGLLKDDPSDPYGTWFDVIDFNTIRISLGLNSYVYFYRE